MRGALRTRDEDRDREGREGAETREELRPEDLETDGDGRLVLGALRTRDDERDGEGREGAETLEELRPEDLETEEDDRPVPGEPCLRMLLTREELLGAKRGDGRADGADGPEGEDFDTDSAERGVELPEGAPRGTLPWVAVRRLKRRQRSSESDRLPPSGRAAVGRGGLAGALTLRSTLLRARIAAGLDAEGRLRRLAGTALDLEAPGCWGRKPGAERPASGLVEARGLAGRRVVMSLRPAESTNRAISWRCWTKERRETLGRERPVEKKRVRVEVARL